MSLLLLFPGYATIVPSTAEPHVIGAFASYAPVVSGFASYSDTVSGFASYADTVDAFAEQGED